MPADHLTADSVVALLDRYGPHQTSPAPSLADAQSYCRRLAATHYENFTVASRLLPREYRQDFANLYAYCRWGDDLADETGDPAHSLALLDWWGQELERCYAGQTQHPVYVALAETIRRRQIPRQPLDDLLVAFRQDQQKTCYETVAELQAYCRYSANPVGRLVLQLGRSLSAETAPLSDSICTGLQWINFCQDVARDADRGRYYLPRESRLAAGYDDAMLARRETNGAFRRWMKTEVARAESWLLAGEPLVAMVPNWLRLDVELFLRGGLAVVAAVRRIDYNLWQQRPVVGRWRKLRLVAAAWWHTRPSRPAAGVPGKDGG